MYSILLGDKEVKRIIYPCIFKFQNNIPVHA